MTPVANFKTFTIRVLTRLWYQGEETWNNSSDYWHRWTPDIQTETWRRRWTLLTLINCSRTHCNSKDTIYKPRARRKANNKINSRIENSRHSLQFSIRRHGNIKEILVILIHIPDCPDLLPNYQDCLPAMVFLPHNLDGCTLSGKDSLCCCTSRTSNYPLASLALSCQKLNV
jgi:hypothetical protein